MNIFQFVGIAFCGVQVCIAVSRLRRLHRWQDALFLAIWAVAIVILFSPDSSSVLANKIGIGRGADLVLYSLGFLFLWFHYEQYVRYKELQDQVTVLVRELAIASARTPISSRVGGDEEQLACKK